MMIRELSNGRLRIEKASLRLLIQYAFHARPWEITAVPAWVSATCYDISAKSETPANAAAMWGMLEPLLEERFGMKTHREKKEFRVYNLTVATRGKLPNPREGTCVGSDPKAQPPRPTPGKPLLTACGSILMPVKPTGASLYGGKIPMGALVSRLTEILGRPVIDKTAFTDLFDLQLDFALDGALEGLPSRLQSAPAEPDEAIRASDPSGAPNIFTALRQQLGLKIESAKAPVEIIVIDRLEKPSAN